MNKKKAKKIRKKLIKQLEERWEQEQPIIDDVRKFRWDIIDEVTRKLTRRQALVYRDILDRHIAELEDGELFELEDEAGLIKD